MAHADDNSGSAANNNSGTGAAPPVLTETEPAPVPPTATVAEVADHVSLGSDVSSGLGDVSSDGEDSFGLDSDDDDSLPLTAADQAENEDFGAQYEGPKLSEKDAGRLMVLMSHASTCCGKHRNESHRDVCRSTQWMMLHVRDCPGTTLNYDICPFPWCRKMKHILFHLVSCTEPTACRICTHPEVSDNLLDLAKLNAQRLSFYRKMLLSKKPEERAAALVTQSGKPCNPTKNPKESVRHAGADVSALGHPGTSSSAPAPTRVHPHPGAAISDPTQSTTKPAARKASKPQVKKPTGQNRSSPSSAPRPLPGAHETKIAITPSDKAASAANDTKLAPPTMSNSFPATPNPIKTEAMDSSPAAGSRIMDGATPTKSNASHGK